MKSIPTLDSLTYRCKYCDWLCTKKIVPELTRVKTKTGNYGDNATPPPVVWTNEQYVTIADPLYFDAQTGSFTASNTITGATSGATATIVSVTDDGSIGTLYLSNISGTFVDNEIIYESALGDELLTNGDFTNWTGDDPSGWTVYGESGVDPEISEVGTNEGHGGSNTGMCNVYTSDATGVGITQGVLTVNKFFEITLNVDTVTKNGIVVKLGHADYETPYTTSGSKTIRSLAGGVTFEIKRLFGVGGTDVTFDDSSVKQITNAALANNTPTSPLTISFAAASGTTPAKINDSANKFVAKKFQSEQPISIVTDSGTNDGTYTIAARGVSPGTLTLSSDDSLTTESAATAGSITISDVTYKPNVTRGCPFCGSMDSK